MGPGTGGGGSSPKSTGKPKGKALVRSAAQADLTASQKTQLDLAAISAVNARVAAPSAPQLGGGDNSTDVTNSYIGANDCWGHSDERPPKRQQPVPERPVTGEVRGL